MTKPRSSTGLATAALLLGTSTLLIGGCNANQPVPSGPAAYQPEGSPPALPDDQMPTPIVIDMDNREAPVRTTIEPVIFDTRAVVPQRQITGMFDGAVRMIKHQLPAHSRDKSLPDVSAESSPLPIGQAIEMDRVNHQGGTGFDAIGQTEWAPPDPTLAVGPDHIVQTVNAAIAFYDKDTGNQTFSTHLGTPGSPGFFEPVGADSNFVFDPKCFYDHKAGRFVVVALETSGASWIDIAVSDDDDPNGIWFKYRTPSVVQQNTSTFWVDYPGFGFDDNAWYVTGNLFGLNNDGFGGQLFRIFDKTPMLSGQPVTFTDIAPGNGASLQIAQMFGDAPICYFVSRRNSNALYVWTILDPLGNPSLRRISVEQLGNAFGPDEGAPNPGGGTIDTLDGRMMNVHYRDGHLYTAHGIDGANGVNVARWYHIDINGWPNSGGLPSLVQQGEITGSPGEHHFFPAIYTDRENNVGLTMSSSSASQFASVRVSGRIQSDPPGTMSEPIELITGSRGADGRWGDYLDIAIDPEDDKTFWIVGMYQRPGGWQTYIDRFTISTPCPPDLDGNGVLNFFDLVFYLDLFNSQSSSADLNNDGQWNFFDITMYMSSFGQGCP